MLRAHDVNPLQILKSLFSLGIKRFPLRYAKISHRPVQCAKFSRGIHVLSGVSEAVDQASARAVEDGFVSDPSAWYKDA